MKHIEIFENERASNYDEFIKKWILNYSFVLEVLPEIIDIKQPDAKKILVVGSGTGNEIQSLVSHPNHSWKITGIDPSPDMLKQAKEKFKKNTQVELFQTVVSQFETSQKFDVATLSLVLHFMPDDGTKKQLLKDISQKIKKGGTFILFDIFGVSAGYTLNLKILEKQLSKVIDSDFVRERIVTMPERIYPISESRITELFMDVGFSQPQRFFQSSIYGAWISQKI